MSHSCPTLCDCILHGILQARIQEWVAFPFSRRSSQPREQTQVSHIAGDPLPAEPQGQPKNTGVGSLSLSLLQWIFLTQELNWGLLHCRWILYQLAIREELNTAQTNSVNLSPADLPDPGIELESPALQVDSLSTEL